MKHLSMIPLLILGACETEDDDVSKRRVAALEAQVTELQTQLAQIKARLDSHDTTLANREPALASLEALLSVISVNDNDDVVINNANLYIQSGSGSTNGPLNGKGNLIVGYDENDSDGTCNGGPLHGQVCEYDGACGAGTCDNIHSVSQKTGSHNVVVGLEHSYVGFGGFVAGTNNRLMASSASVVGGSGQTADTYGQVLP